MVAKRVRGLPDAEVSAQTRYERRQTIKDQVAAQLRAEFYAATVNAFGGLLKFSLQPVTDIDGAIGISIEIVDQDTTLPRLERWAFIHSYTLDEFLAVLGTETGRRVAKARLGDVEVTVVGKVVGDAADLD